MKQNFLLIAGCPRSGTSALGHLVGDHPHSVIGHERYKHLLKNSTKTYGAHLYEKKRFFDFRPGDTNQTPELTTNNRRTYQEAYRKFDDSKLLGDKTPHYYTQYTELIQQMPTTKFLFIFRHINDVCSSFNRNCDDANKSWSQDYTHAVSNWNESLQQTLSALSRHAERFFVIEYEKFYSGNESLAKHLFQFLGLEYALIQEKYRSACDKYHQQVKTKTPNQRGGQTDYIQERADWASYEKMQVIAAKEH